MRFVKPRKPRGTKLNGEKSYDMCEGCYMPFCDSFAASEKYRHKIHSRLKTGVCPACGHNPCRCKSKLHTKTSVIVTHNNKKEKRKLKEIDLNCSICGSWLRMFNGGKIVHSGDYIEEDICYDCMEKHCAKTDCNKCKYGTERKCKHRYIKNNIESEDSE